MPTNHVPGCLHLARSRRILRRSKSSVIESAADDLPASSVPPPLIPFRSNLRGLGKAFRQRTKPSHGGRVTFAGAPKQCFPRATERDTAPAIRTDRPATLNNPLKTVTAFDYSALVRRVDQSRICVVAFGPPAREDRVRNGFRRSDGAYPRAQRHARRTRGGLTYWCAEELLSQVPDAIIRLAVSLCA